jgi:hypothetical protein
MCLLVGTSGLIKDVETGLAQSVEPRLKLGPDRFGVERGKRRQYGIRTKVRINSQQLVERNLGFFRNWRSARLSYGA